MKNTRKRAVGGAVMVVVVGGLAGWNSSGAELRGDTTSARETGIVGSNLGMATYEVDPVHTNVIFKIRHGSVSNFYGRFNTVKGMIEFDEENIERSSIDFTVQTGSVDTNSRVRDGHVKGTDFLNVRQYPQATFRSTSIKRIGDGAYLLTGEMTLQGKTVTIEANMHDIRTGEFNSFDVLGIEATFSLLRSDFEITKYLDAENPEMGPLGDRVDLIVAIEAIKQ